MDPNNNLNNKDNVNGGSAPAVGANINANNDLGVTNAANTTNRNLGGAVGQGTTSMNAIGGQEVNTNNATSGVPNGFSVSGASLEMPPASQNSIPNFDPALVAPSPGDEKVGMTDGAMGYQPNNVRLAATDPIMKPEPAPAPDPVEEELKAPMKAAGPVPGSIGSAVSMPSQNNEILNGGVPQNATSIGKNVSFSEPAAQVGSRAQSVKKKSNKVLLIVLAIVMLLIVAGLAVVLVMQLNGASQTASDDTPTGLVVSDNAEAPTGGGGGGVDMVECVRSLTADELADYGATTGELDVTMMFDEEGGLYEVTVANNLSSADSGEDESAATESYSPEEIVASETPILEINTADIEDKAASEILAEFEGIDYTCEVL